MNWKQQPPSEFLQDALQDPCFYEYFVQGANGFITENVFRDFLYIVNALPIVFHSVKFSPIVEKYVNDIIDVSKPGNVITVEECPISVNVKVCLSKNTPIDIKRALVHLSLVKELDRDRDAQIILPLTKYACSWDNTESWSTKMRPISAWKCDISSTFCTCLHIIALWGGPVYHGSKPFSSDCTVSL